LIFEELIIYEESILVYFPRSQLFVQTFTDTWGRSTNQFKCFYVFRKLQ